MTFALLGLQTLGTITHDGIWRFMEESRHILGPELWTQVNTGSILFFARVVSCVTRCPANCFQLAKLCHCALFPWVRWPSQDMPTWETSQSNLGERCWTFLQRIVSRRTSSEGLSYGRAQLTTANPTIGTLQFDTLPPHLGGGGRSRRKTKSICAAEVVGTIVCDRGKCLHFVFTPPCLQPSGSGCITSSTLRCY